MNNTRRVNLNYEKSLGPLDEGLRLCWTCKEIKSIEEFRKHNTSKDGYSKKCGSCYITDYQVVHQYISDEKRPSDRRSKVMIYKYGLLPGDYDNWYESQNGCCAICGVHEDDLGSRLHIDHCHQTDEVRGLLCYGCNIGIGFFKESPERMESAMEYLRNFWGTTIK